MTDSLIELSPRPGETRCVPKTPETIERGRRQHRAVLLGGVNYYTGRRSIWPRYPKLAIAKAASSDSTLLTPLATSSYICTIGTRFRRVWLIQIPKCGPGAVGGAFIHERHAHSFDLPRVRRMVGHDKESRFLMGPDFKPMPAPRVAAFHPPILRWPHCVLH